MKNIKIFKGVVRWNGGYPDGQYSIGNEDSNTAFNEFDGCDIIVTIEVVKTKEEVDWSNYDS